MVSVFTKPDVNTREVGRTRDKRRKPRREAETADAVIQKLTRVSLSYRQTKILPMLLCLPKELTFNANLKFN